MGGLNFLPFVMYSLRKNNLVFNFDYGSVIENRSTENFTENLMRKHTNQLNVKRCNTVNDRFKIHFKSAVIACKCPRLGIVIFTVSVRNMELNLIELM